MVGAGTAGCVLAARLSEDAAATVLLIEAGPDYPTLDLIPPDVRFGQAEGDVIPRGHLWDLTARFERGRVPERLARGRLVGGSGAVNGQVFLRGAPEDFATWVEAGAEGWGFDDLLPHFRRVESDLDFGDEWHGTQGPVPVRRYPREEWLPPQVAFFEACEAAGFASCADANHPLATGVSPIPFNNLGGVRQSAALTHLAPARGRRNLTVAADCEVSRILFRRSRAIGVEAMHGGRHIRYDAREVVLAAGVIGTPKLLLLSGIGPQAELASLGIASVADLPGVGRNLRDHQVVDLTWIGREGAWQPPPRAPLLQVVLSYSSGGKHRNDLKITARSRTMATRPESADVPVLAIVPGVYLPDGSGALRLASSDVSIAPRVDFDFLGEEGDRARLREALHLALELGASATLAPWTARRTAPADADLKSDASLDAWLRSAVRSSQHACGTCRMGREDDPYSVVGPAGKVKGIEGLRVADASIFPRIVRAHINATTLAVAEKMAALVRRGR